MKKHGTLLVFAPGMRKEQLELTIQKYLGHLLDPETHGGKPPRVESFDPEEGTPVFYIP